MGGLSFAVPGGLVTVVALAIAFVALIGWGFRETRSLPAPRRRALRALRVATALVAFACAVQPRLVREQVQEIEGRLVVLLDGSRSMTIDRDGESRWEEALGALEGWREDGDAAELARFGSALTPIGWDELEDQRPRDDESRLRAALEELAEQDDLGAVL